ncbi:Trm112 family protein [Candidatus Poribacteria bacterium]|nr:Trm112 family protein [Candidatus Poribacteria bacterium]
MEGGSTERIVVHLTDLTEPQGTIKISKTLLDILACPACKGGIEHDETAQKLVCVGECQRRYPIREGIPVMLIDEAELPDGKQG